MQQYGEVFARVYDLRWRSFATSLAPRLLALFRRYAPSADQSLLDLCCGTGQLAVHFLQNGFRVVGVDRSPHMLKAARANCHACGASGRADFVQADVTDFAMDSGFGLVASTFDALNHVEDTTALERVFRSVRRALRPDGLFFFDLNTRKALLHWNHMQVTEDEQVTVINRGIYAPEMDRAYARISGFIRDDDGRYSRFEEVFYNTPFRLSEVRALLEESGMADVHLLSFSDFMAVDGDPEEMQRVAFVARSGAGATTRD